MHDHDDDVISYSNWKNIKGYTIPLDKRLAADGRGLQEVQVNDKFAKLSESLFLAERAARTEIEQRATLAKKMARKAKEVQEDEFRQLATQARTAAQMETTTDDQDREEESYDAAAAHKAAEGTSGALPLGEYQSDSDDDGEKARRDALRRDRERDLKREMRQESRRQEKGVSSSQREKERDVSERIALGQHAPVATKDTQFDQRLFNQDTGAAAGFGSDDSYNVYSKPLFSGSSTAQVYRPKDIEGYEVEGAVSLSAGASATSKFKADRGFSGTEHNAIPGGSRAKPVEFERGSASNNTAAMDADDPYGLGSLLTETRKPSALDHIGSKDRSAASSSSSSNRRRSRSRSRERSRSRSKERSRRY